LKTVATRPQCSGKHGNLLLFFLFFVAWEGDKLLLLLSLAAGHSGRARKGTSIGLMGGRRRSWTKHREEQRGKRRGKADGTGKVWGVVVLERQGAPAKGYVPVAPEERRGQGAEGGEQEGGKKQGELQLLAVSRTLALRQSEGTGGPEASISGVNANR
jgi:hypothetical protein